MSFAEDEEILEDFLVEAGEILEQLSDQLVQLEQRPDDKDLLNAIFRGFHTVKGGSGFLQLTALVNLCHVTENLFDILRTGQRQVSSELMDVVLQALDSVNEMFQAVKLRQEPEPASAALLSALEDLVSGKSPAPVPDTGHDSESDSGLASDTITDDEFEALLDQLQGAPGEPASPSSQETTDVEAVSGTDDDEISDEEFEALLDQLHGSGSHQGTPATAAAADPATEPAQSPSQATRHSSTHSTTQNSTQSPSQPAPSRIEEAGKAVREPAHATGDVTVRVDTRRLDEIMNMVGELVLVRNRLVRIGMSSNDEALSRTLANLDLVTADLQASVMKTRMQPVKKVFGRFPRVVRDLARSLNKQVVLEMQGEETDLDKNLVEALADPLVHLVRNAVDHGIELPDIRKAKGKPEQGTVMLTAEQEGDHILLSIQDDGAGMDPEKLRRKAVEKGLLDQDAADRLSDRDCFELIFAPGFSTKQEISDVSGRGVGMDVVKTKITQLNGSVTIDSAPDKGSRIEIKVPLTLAIMPTLMVIVGGQTFALPLGSVNEIFNLDLGRTNVVDGQQVVTVREKSVPLFHLARWLSGTAAVDSRSAQANVVIVSVGSQRIAFVVDSLVGQEEVVIKPLGRMLHGTPGMAGATITGDGRIAIILDVPGLLKRYAN